MNSLDPKERQKVQGLLRVPSQADIQAESSEDDEGNHHNSKHTGASTSSLPPRDPNPPSGVTKLGRRMKDKVSDCSNPFFSRRAETRIMRGAQGVATSLGLKLSHIGEILTWISRS